MKIGDCVKINNNIDMHKKFYNKTGFIIDKPENDDSNKYYTICLHKPIEINHKKHRHAYLFKEAFTIIVPDKKKKEFKINDTVIVCDKNLNLYGRAGIITCINCNSKIKEKYSIRIQLSKRFAVFQMKKSEINLLKNYIPKNRIKGE